MTDELSTYIYNRMIEESQNYQWRIVSDSHKGAIELYLAVKLAVEPKEYVQDIIGQVNKEGIIYFEELVCFYDQMNNKIIKENYLHAIPVDPIQGVEAGYVDAFLKQLNITISTAKSQLRLFLEDEDQKEFELIWNEENMENTVETMKKTGNYSRKQLIFSKEKEESLVEQLKGETYDGLERI